MPFMGWNLSTSFWLTLSAKKPPLYPDHIVWVQGWFPIAWWKAWMGKFWTTWKFLTIFTLIYGMAKNNCIGNHSALLECVKNHFSLCLNKWVVLHVSKAVDQLLKKSKMDWFVTMSTPQITQKNLSYSLRCGDFQGWTSFTAIKEIVTSCEPWPWLTDRSAMAMLYTVLIVGNNNTTVGPLSREFSRLTLAFSDSRRRNECGRRRRSPLIPGVLKIPCYVTLHGNKLVVQARDIIAGENRTE